MDPVDVNVNTLTGAPFFCAVTLTESDEKVNPIALCGASCTVMVKAMVVSALLGVNCILPVPV